MRARMAATGESYTTALRALDTTTGQQADRVPARASWTAPHPSGVIRGMTFEITLHDPRAARPSSFWFWTYPNATPPDVTVERELHTHGWRLAAQPQWPSFAAAGDTDLELVRNDIGRRTDEAHDALDAVGRDYHDVHELYLAAVAHSLTRAGIDWQDYHANPDEPRDGAILLADPLPGDEALHIAWREDRGWYSIPSSDAHSALGDAAIDLPGALPLLAEPHDVAAAVVDVLGGLARNAEPLWQPPADYDRDAAPAQDWWDANPALERSLAAYATHPAHTITPRCDGCGTRAAHYVVESETDVPADDGPGRANRTGMVCELCDNNPVLSRRRVRLSDLSTHEE